MVKVTDALNHAHESGVIHRDVKPSNILITKGGNPKVTDFGLAKVEDALTLSRTGDFAGTPYYMSPEQAMSRRMGIDHRTDVYSLGVTLYEILTLKIPFEGKTSHEVFKKIMFVDPLDPHKANPKVPRDLGIICLKAMEKLPDKRYQTMVEFYNDLRRFLSGDVILAKPAGLGTRFWKRVKRNPVVSAAVGVALVALVAFAVVVPWVVATKEREKRETEETARIEIEEQWKRAESEKKRALAAEREADEQARLAEERLEDFLRLSDVKLLSDLEKEAEELWPAYPEKVAALEDWLVLAEELAGRLEGHRKILVELQEKALPLEDTAAPSTWAFEGRETAWWHETLDGLLSGLERFVDEEEGTLKNVRERLEFATTIEERSIKAFRELWDEAIASIADEEECPQYNGLVIEPIMGLVPIGRDPMSKLWEFAHLQTGEIPLRDTEGRLFLSEDMGLVFVLIPGGIFRMGAKKPSQDNPIGSPNVDPEAEQKEGPVHKVAIQPFLLSKYEMTQGQWLRFTKDNPSIYTPGANFGGKVVNLRHPVENVSWNDCVDVLSKLKLRLPSEAEWEYACRAGTCTVFWTGDEKESLQGAANLADLFYKKNAANISWTYEEWLDDGYAVHAPVGSFSANAFGLHDVYGNGWEWCEDINARYENTPVDGSANKGGTSYRVFRGGGWNSHARNCRSAYRGRSVPGFRLHNLGFRPALSIQ
jgi:formylglycine-generating enzyme required for sulfatase activity